MIVSKVQIQFNCHWIMQASPPPTPSSVICAYILVLLTQSGVGSLPASLTTNTDPLPSSSSYKWRDWWHSQKTFQGKSFVSSFIPLNPAPRIWPNRFLKRKEAATDKFLLLMGAWEPQGLYRAPSTRTLKPWIHLNSRRAFISLLLVRTRTKRYKCHLQTACQLPSSQWLSRHGKFWSILAIHVRLEDSAWWRSADG